MLSVGVVQNGVVGMLLLWGMFLSPAWAQSDVPSSTSGTMESEAVLRERLQHNVQEREQLLQQLEDLSRVRDETLPKHERPQLYRETTDAAAEGGASWRHLSMNWRISAS